jgi:lipid II:glycine glycyltransferase (peptidoglycan interpeptide bridge formation enzyme)
LLPVFWDLYEKSIQRWSAVQHEPLWLTRWRNLRATPPEMLATVARQFGTNCGIWVAWSSGVPAAAIIVLRSGVHAKYWRGAMDKELATRVRANEFLHRLAIEEACADGCRFYDMGRSRPGSPLAKFKEKFGATQWLGYTLHAERFPVRPVAHWSRDTVKRMIRFRDV